VNHVGVAMLLRSTQMVHIAFRVKNTHLSWYSRQTFQQLPFTTRKILIGIILGSLAKQSGNEEFADIAYGDEINNKFMWENL